MEFIKLAQFLLNCSLKSQETSMDQQLPKRPSYSPTNAEGEITKKVVILKIQEWWRIVWPKMHLIIAASLTIGLIIALDTKFRTKPTYTASYKLFFQEESRGLSSAMRLASSFGFVSGGGSSSSSAAVQEYLTSRSNIAYAMTAELENGRLIDQYYSEAMEVSEEFTTEFTTKFYKNQRYTDSTITVLFHSLNNNVLSVIYNEESGQLYFKVRAENEAFAFALANTLVKGTQEKFISWKRAKGQSAVKAFQTKVDSLELSLDETLRRLGEYQDQNNSLISAVDKMEQLRLNIDLQSQKVAYGEYIKGLEMSKAELMNIDAPFQYFDQPTYPLLKEEDSAARAGVFSSVITGLLLVLFFIARLEIGNIMAG